jgi:hypothetical protein
MNVNSVLLRRKNRMLVPASTGTTSRALIATFNANVQSLGYSLSPRLIKALERTSEATSVLLLEEAVETLKKLKGVHAYKPMYPNFPQQVMEADECELYLNAVTHYISFMIVDWTGDPDNIWLPKYDKAKRAPLEEKFKARIIDLMDEEEVAAMATAIATSNTSISETDKDDLRALHGTGRLSFPKLVPNKENLAVLGALFIDGNVDLAPHFKTATDVLRLATALSNGDVSLADDSKFASFSKPRRRMLLGLLDKCQLPEEDMLRWEMRWKRLGERLHPGTYRKRFKTAFRAFDALRNTKIRTIRTHVEAAVRGGDIVKSITLLSTRPGDFARRLDHLLRMAEKRASQNRVVTAFEKVASEVSTPVLLQAMNHFKHRNEPLRVVFPKGNVAQVMSLDKPLPPLPQGVIDNVVDLMEATLTDRFAKLPKLGKVWIEPALRECLVPFSQRSASKALRTLVRGSKLKFGADKDTLRFFIWWKEPKDDRTDLDLSAVLHSADWELVEQLAYWNLRSRDGGGSLPNGMGYHSGDITSAPNGASEFIDINIPKALEMGARYCIMSVNSYSEQDFCDLPECNAGWMLREEPRSGEVYDPRTVNDKVDLAMAATAGIPMIIDLVERKVIWVDASMTTNPRYVNNVHANRGTIELLGRAFASLHRPNLFDLLALHAVARGKLVQSRDKADVVFSLDAGTPFEIERIASEFMSDAKAVEKAKGAKR